VNPARFALRAFIYSAFYRLPHTMRVRLVRLLVRKSIVGAVVFVRDAEAGPPGRLLLLRQPPGRGWTLPAGLLRKREEPIIGALRELVEETGIALRAEQLRPAVPNAIVHAKGWVDVVFEADVPASTTELKVDGAEVWEAAWHPLDDLPRLSEPTARLLGRYGMGPLAGYPDAAEGSDARSAAGDHP
jgi:ADP-ribose pyrophosphatase YjhB (NUDIX family)